MRFLLDTHAFLRFISDDSNLSNEAKALISEPENQVWVSIASLWEPNRKRSKPLVRCPQRRNLI